MKKQPSNKISKWVASDGEYYQNTVRAAAGIGGVKDEVEDDEDDVEDGGSSAGGGSHAGSDGEGSGGRPYRGSGDGAAPRRPARHRGNDDPATGVSAAAEDSKDGKAGGGGGVRQGMSMVVDNSDNRSDGGERCVPMAMPDPNSYRTLISSCLTALPPSRCTLLLTAPRPACRARRACLTATAPGTSSVASGTRSSSSS